MTVRRLKRAVLALAAITVALAATGFALAPARAFGHKDAFVQLYRTTDLFGMPLRSQGARKFAIGGPIGNALLLALLTSGPEVAR